MICAIVLAAGRSERMGTQKLLLPLDGKPVITRVVDELLRSPVEKTLVVTGRDGDRLRAALGGRAVEFVENPDTASAMLDSVRCGLRALPAGCQAVVVALGDQPGISHTLVGAIVSRFRAGECRFVVPECDGHRGHPLLFSAEFRDELLTGHGDRGLRGLLDAHAKEVFRLAISDAAILADMDTPADYQQHQERFASSIKP